MKKAKLLKVLLVTSVIAAMAIVACLGLVACNKHQHTLSDWTYTDGTGHYKTCTDGKCTEPVGTKIESGSHDTTGTDGACSVCGYKATVTPPAHEHTLSAWTYTDGTGHYKTCTGANCTQPANTKIETGTHDTDGTDGACSVCGYKATVTPPAHEHTLSDWTYTDGTGHYKTCTGDNCTQPANTKIETGTHDTTGTDGACSVCGYKATVTPSEQEHTLTDWQNDDPAGHYKTCTNDNCVLAAGTKIAQEDHDNDGQDGACSVCGYKATVTPPAHTCQHVCPVEGCGKCLDATCEDCADKCPGHTAQKTIFEQLRDADNNVIGEDFATGYEADQKLAEFGGIYGVKGLYSSDKYDDSHYVKITNGAAQQVAPSSNGANVSMIVDLGIVTGKIEGYVELTASDMGSSWALFQIIGTSASKKDSEVFAITTAGTSSAGFTFTYRVDGAIPSGATPANTIAATKNTLYKIYFKLDNGKITVTINGTALVSDLDVTITEVCGLKFIASNNGKRLLTIDNIAVTGTAAELAAYKTKFNGKVNSLKTTYSATCTQNISDVEAAYDKATAAIDAATEVSAMLAAYNTCDAEMKAIKTDAVLEAEAALATAKETALTELNGYKGGADNFSTEGENGNKTAYLNAITAGTAAINAATTPAEVTTALNAAKEVINGIWTDDQLTATKYTVTFVNSPVEAKEVAENEKVVRPEEDPTDADAVFVNWYSNEACTELFDFDTPITANTKIYAKWEGKLVEAAGSTTYGSNNLTAVPDSGATSDATTSDAYITWYISGTSETMTAGISGYTNAIKLKGASQNGSTVRYIQLHLEKAGTVKVVFHLTGDDNAGRWVSIDETLKGKNDTPSADKSATATKKNVATTIECELEAGDWYVNFSNQVALCEITITISSTSTTYFTGITGTPTTTSYDAVPTAADVNLAGLSLAVKGSEDTVALTADSVKAKVSVVVNAPEEDGAYSITVKYGNYVTYTYDITVTTDAGELDAE